MNTTTQQTSAKPKFWVTMTDKFMSGWGMAENKTNKLVISCTSYEQAELIAKNARLRSEMRYVNICSTKPSYGNHILVSSRTFDDMGEIWKRP